MSGILLLISLFSFFTFPRMDLPDPFCANIQFRRKHPQLLPFEFARLIDIFISFPVSYIESHAMPPYK